MMQTEILHMYTSGESTRSIAKILGISQGLAAKTIRLLGISRNRSAARLLAAKTGRITYKSISDNLPSIPWNKDKIGVQASTRKGKHYIRIAGEKHWNWQGGKSTEQHKRYTLEGKEWTANVLKRDDYTCQCCNIRGVYLHAHHVESFAKNPEKRLDLSNGLTLCKKCHNLIHIFIKQLDKREELLEHPRTDKIATAQLERAIAIAQKAFCTWGQSASDPIRNDGQVQRLEAESRPDSNASTSIPQAYCLKI